MIKKYNVPGDFSSLTGYDSIEEYLKLKTEVHTDPEAYWAKVAERIDWFEKWTDVNKTNYHDAHIEWFTNGKLNASYNCIDRHIKNGLGEKTALIWQSNDVNVSKNVTYNELLVHVSQFANALKKANIQKGDRVCIYMQMIPEAIVAMLALSLIHI